MEQQEQKPNKKSITKNKKILSIILVVILVIIIGGIGIFFVTNKNTNSNDSNIPGGIDSSSLPELTPESIGMIVTVRPDKKALSFELKNAAEIERVEYTIEYEKDLDGETVPEGFLGEMNIGEDGITETDEWPFGSCSAGKCVYHNVISDITITLKVTKKDGKEYQVRKIVKL